jgi:hypothetical protein
MSPIFEAVNIPFVQQFMDGDRFVPNDVLESAASAMLDELLRWTDALRPLRASV